MRRLIANLKIFLKGFVILHKKLLKRAVIFFVIIVFLTLLILILTNPILQNFTKHQITKAKLVFIKLFDNSYNKINIIGIVNSDENYIREIIAQKTKNVNLEHLGSKIIDDIRFEIEKINWVKKVVINRNILTSLDIKIIEYHPFAIWKNYSKEYVIDKDGVLINVENIRNFDYLLIVNGENANLNVRSLFNIFATTPEMSQEIYSASLINNRRWNIRFHNNILVKLPEKNIETAWKKLHKIYRNLELNNDLKLIDLRIENKIYIK